MCLNTTIPVDGLMPKTADFQAFPLYDQHGISCVMRLRFGGHHTVLGSRKPASIGFVVAAIKNLNTTVPINCDNQFCGSNARRAVIQQDRAKRWNARFAAYNPAWFAENNVECNGYRTLTPQQRAAMLDARLRQLEKISKP